MTLANPISRPTIADVARRCGVSKTTVSVILNNSLASSSARVSPETQARVKQAADELGYRPSWRGRVLSNRKTHIVGVLYAPPMPIVVRGNYEGIMAGINETLHAHSYHMLYVPLGDDTREWGAMLLDQRMDGCLVLSRLRDPLAALLKQGKLPATLVNADSDFPCPQVMADELDGAQQITKHLLERDHKKIWLLMGKPPAHYSVTQRTRGYSEAMSVAGLGAHVRVFDGTAEEFVHVMKQSADRPTAAICYTHFMAMKQIRLLWEAGIKVPDELSVATFSNASPVEDFIPPLTTMALPTEEMGRTAAKMVLEQIETSGTAAAKKVVIKETLVIRKSTARCVW
jgi:DNA-binding LacI/PurR family transcriptional regulator